MTCRDNGRYTVEYGWILSRDQGFRNTELYSEVLARAIDKYGWKTINNIASPQAAEDCEWDYMEYYPSK